MTNRAETAAAAPAADIARRILHAESAHGERIVAWGRGAIWIVLAALILSGVAGFHTYVGWPATVAVGVGLLVAGCGSLVYAYRLRAERWTSSLALLTASADLVLLPLLALVVSFFGTPAVVVKELVGQTPTLMLLIFGLAAVALRQQPRALAFTTVWVVMLCLGAAVYTVYFPRTDLVPPDMRTDFTPLWVVRAVLVGMTGIVLGVAVKNARAMVHRTSSEVAERARVMGVFGRYVAPEIRDAVVRGETHAQIVEVTVMFTDLRDFTALSERIAPDELIRLLNRHFEALVPVVQRHGGTVNKFVGDALMATFGAPLPLAEHARAATRAAVDMIAAMDQLNRRLADEARPPLRMGVGIATGPVVVGSLGDRERAEYAVLGDTVNTAARLEGMNKELGTQIVVSEATAAQVGDGVPLRELGSVRVKGKGEALRVFTPITAAATASMSPR